VKPFVVKSSQGGRELRLEERKGEYFRVTLTGDGISATKGVYAYTDGPLLVGFFASIAADWRGWEGERVWGALESDFSVRATSDRLGHIRLDVELRNHDPDDNWCVSAPIFLDAGSLDRIAADAEVFFADARATV
jgi:hypothetical protein